MLQYRQIVSGLMWIVGLLKKTLLLPRPHNPSLQEVRHAFGVDDEAISIFITYETPRDCRAPSGRSQ